MTGEPSAIDQAFKTVEVARRQRDAAEEQIFALVYGVGGAAQPGAEVTDTQGVTP